MSNLGGSLQQITDWNNLVKFEKNFYQVLAASSATLSAPSFARAPRCTFIAIIFCIRVVQ